MSDAINTLKSRKTALLNSQADVREKRAELEQAMQKAATALDAHDQQMKWREAAIKNCDDAIKTLSQIELYGKVVTA